MKLFKINTIIVLLSLVILGCSTATDDYSSEDTSTKTISDYSNEATVEGNIYAEIAESESFAKSENQTESYPKAISTTEKITYKEYRMIISSSAAAKDVNIESKRKIVRTADLSFRTSNVAKSTYIIEQNVAKLGGWVSTSYLVSTELQNYKVKVSKDSSLVIRKYVVSNTITIRTPFEYLDTTIKTFVPLIEFLNHRNIIAEDVTFKQLAKEMQQKRLAEYNVRMKRHTSASGGRLSDITEAERQILLQQERADALKIEELNIFDKILYSTINVHIYESEKYEYTMIANPKEIESYKIEFGKRLVKSIKNGWFIIQDIIIFLVNLWGVVLLGIIVFICVRYVSRKYFRKNKKQ